MSVRVSATKGGKTPTTVAIYHLRFFLQNEAGEGIPQDTLSKVARSREDELKVS